MGEKERIEMEHGITYKREKHYEQTIIFLFCCRVDGLFGWLFGE